MRPSQSAASLNSTKSDRRTQEYYSSSLAGHFRGADFSQTAAPRRRPQTAAVGVRYPLKGYPSLSDSLPRSAQLSRDNLSLSAQFSRDSLFRSAQLSRSRSQASGIVRAGGRLFAESPVAGFTHEELVREAKMRLEHNRQRAKLKQLLQAASGPGQTVSVENLRLSAKIAKIALPDALLFNSPYANRYTATRTEGGEPKDIRWKSFHSAIAYPKLSSEADRLMRRSLRPHPEAAAAQAVAAQAVAGRGTRPPEVGPGVETGAILRAA